MKTGTSATAKLATWYLLILLTVSLLFSVIIFQIAHSEIQTRLLRLTNDSNSTQTNLIISPELADEQLATATSNLIISLGYLNLVVLLGGGAGAYFLARRTLQPIESAHEAQSRFVANASHQLRTPLAIMRAETELALRDKSTPKSELRHTLESNLEEINHLTELSTMLLDLSRAEKYLNTKDGIVDVVKLLSDLIRHRRAEQRVEMVAPESLNATLHMVAMRELCAVLLDNALKHSPEHSKVHITLKSNKQQFTLAITNSGTISSHDLPHIFERFYRGQQRSDSYGLGLSLAEQLTKALGGTITVKSGDAKTIFTVSLPKN